MRHYQGSLQSLLHDMSFDCQGFLMVNPLL